VEADFATLRGTHENILRDLRRAAESSEQSLRDTHAGYRTIQGWKQSYGKLQKQFSDKSQKVVTLSATIAAKDRKIELLQEEHYYYEFSDETHHTRQNRYKKENV
jgi:hypothetical protein